MKPKALNHTPKSAESPSKDPDVDPARDDSVPESGAAAPTEIGGRDGPDPTRYGDWEKNGRCIDF